MANTLRIAALCWGIVLASTISSARAETLLVFAAQSMADAAHDIAELYQAQTGIEVLVSLGATSTMARQIEARAPANIFISANLQWIEYLQDRQALVPETIVGIAGNQLVLVAPLGERDNSIAEDFSDLPDTLGNDRLAIADPAHVPAGIYAEAALRTLGIWDAVSTKLAPATNVRSALRFVEQGAAPAGIVYRTDAMASSKVEIVHPIPTDAYPPILYQAAVTSEFDTPASREFLSFLQTEAAADVLRGYGFLRPSEAPR